MPGYPMFRRVLFFALVLGLHACGGCGDSNDGPKKVEPCGDGLIGFDETCDIAIMSGAGACPTECPSFDACAPMVLQGTTCTAECVEVVPECGDDDGCCPSGCTDADDGDCMTEMQCGNGEVDGIETCDFAIPQGEPGACFCPPAQDVCSRVEESGQAAFCSLECSTVAITQCINGDGCCPTGCSGADNDCPAECGNGVVEGGEVCDGNCPLACDDGDACTDDFLVGSEANCDVMCDSSLVRACTDGDGCCPANCDANDDSDCMPQCGNGVIEAGETCDGNCPTVCSDGLDCTMDVLTGDPSTCNVDCSFVDITACVDGDQCCPVGCTSATDSDCSSTCGNNMIEPPELCDGNCPVACDDGDVCTTDALSGSAATCNAQCSALPITLCIDNDGCCPPTCTFAADNDCMCIPTTCASEGYTCGSIVDDGCMGGPELCGMCADGSTCIGNFCELDFDVGDACSSDFDCTGICITQAVSGWDNGYCSLACTSDADCGAPNHCNSDGFCVQDCVSNAECRPGYECFDGDGDGRDECAPVASGAGSVGDACTRYGDCGGGQTGACILQDIGFKDGYCTEICSTDVDCPANSHCLPPGLCFADCTGAADCRGNGYDCLDVDADATNECWPVANGAGATGDACTGYWDCGGGQFGLCLTTDDGWPSGYCSVFCGPSEGTCITGTSCWTDPASSDSVCLDDCQNTNQCRVGYTCADPGLLGDTACIP